MDQLELPKKISIMKRALTYVSVLALVVTLHGLVGCKKNEEPGKKAEISTPQRKQGGTVSAQKNSFQEVTAQLDPGGSVYVYLSTEQFLDGVSAKALAL